MSPTATVAAVIVRAEATSIEVLLTKRNVPPFKGYWCLPGGHIDPYEDARTAVVREVKEETGYDFSPAFELYQDEILPDQEIHHVVLIFRGEASGAPAASADEVESMEWFSVEEASDLDLAFRHAEILAAVDW